MRTRYAVHPGYVLSQSDGDEHYISAPRLAQLYQLQPDEWFDWENSRSQFGRVWEDYVHLFPRYDGDYGRPDAGSDDRSTHSPE